MTPPRRGRYVWLWLFGLALGWFEAAVVVYLRKIYYPDGFRFPIVLAAIDVAGVEIAREAASLLLLAAGARLAGSFFLERFAAFMLLFGIWDIFYYVVLKLVLGWPESLATWDVLFLIPVPWIGPVWAPVAVSLALIGCGSHLFWTADRPRVVTALDAAVTIGAGLLVILSFTVDYRIVIDGGMPGTFAWPLFACGLLLGLGWYLWRERSRVDGGVVLEGDVPRDRVRLE